MQTWPNKNDGAACLLRHLTEPFEDGTYLVGSVHIYAVTQVGLDRIEGNQSSICLLDRLRQSMIVQRKLPLIFVDDQHTGTICTQRIQPGFDRIRQAIFRSLVNDVGGRQS